ncbi:MAG: hypothetical protein JWN15_1071, partial [Firmicutes bacterium]|nr:hypothetical protein [Bacillota bacterium]
IATVLAIVVALVLCRFAPLSELIEFAYALIP